MRLFVRQTYEPSVTALPSTGRFEPGLGDRGCSIGRAEQDADFASGIRWGPCCVPRVWCSVFDEGSCDGTQLASSGCDAVSDDSDSEGSPLLMLDMRSEDNCRSMGRQAQPVYSLV